MWSEEDWGFLVFGQACGLCALLGDVGCLWDGLWRDWPWNLGGSVYPFAGPDTMIASSSTDEDSFLLRHGSR